MEPLNINAIAPAIIAAIAALSGVAIASIFSLLERRADKKHERLALLRTKFEEMAYHFLSSTYYALSVNNANSLQELLCLGHSDAANRARILSILYFPEFSDSLDRYIGAQQEWYKHALWSYHAAGSVGIVGDASLSNVAHKKVLDNLYEQRNSMIEQFVSAAASYSR